MGASSYVVTTYRSCRQGQHRLLIGAASHLVFGENAVRGDPVARRRERLAGVRLEHDALTRSPSPGVHQIAEARRKFLAVIVRIELRPQVDVALRQP